MHRSGSSCDIVSLPYPVQHRPSWVVAHIHIFGTDPCVDVFQVRVVVIPAALEKANGESG
jgi:hypothetical protein